MNAISFSFTPGFALCVFAIAAAGCNHDSSHPNTTAARNDVGAMPPPAGTVGGDAAAQTLADARCEREARCNNVGQGRKWASADLCRTDLVAKNRGELRVSECPNGVGQADLNKCMAEIQAEDCNSPFDTLARLAACRVGELCRLAAAGRRAGGRPARRPARGGPRACQ